VPRSDGALHFGAVAVPALVMLRSFIKWNKSSELKSSMSHKVKNQPISAIFVIPLYEIV
jgi:hypothetical protein